MSKKQIGGKRTRQKQDLLRRLPKVDELLKTQAVAALLKKYPRTIVVDAVREAIDKARDQMSQAEATDKATEAAISLKALAAEAGRIADRVMKPSLRSVINATGVVVHTNLGRSILPDVAIEAIKRVAGAYSNTEFDVAAGKRGSRHDHVENLIIRLTGAEAAIAVNNNAAAVLLALSALAKGKEVIVSRGQLVEIGGSFRIPDVMRQSGARLVEVGSTNKTHAKDYRDAITPKTGVLMRAHPSNFQVVGFSAEVPLTEMVGIARENGLMVIDDLGSGVMVDVTKAGLPYEPTVNESVVAGVDVATFSGDKLLGGPQAGIAVGTNAAIGKMKKHPLARAVRIDKMTLAALEATLKLYFDESRAIKEIPTLAALYAKPADLKKRADSLAREINKRAGSAVAAESVKDMSKAGGGALPLAELPTAAIRLTADKLSVNKLETALRRHEPPVIGRIKDGALLLDLRTILPSDEKDIVAAVAAATRR
ncbi:MAG: L-seryl-tRNA(Sec) selenium transferase [Actinomycetota bacterium]